MQNDQPLGVSKLSDALLTIQTVCAITGLNRQFIYRATSAKTFPEPIRIGNSKQIRWRSADVKTWMAEQKPKSAKVST